MKTAVCGVWHVHAGDYTKRAQALDEVVGFWEEDDTLAEQFQSVFPIRRFGSLEELLESDAEGVIVCTATNEHIRVMPRIAAGVRLQREDFIRMGHGGLCLGCGECHYPACGFGKG